MTTANGGDAKQVQMDQNAVVSHASAGLENETWNGDGVLRRSG